MNPNPVLTPADKVTIRLVLYSSNNQNFLKNVGNAKTQI